jgi:hypothetical protein
VTFRPCGLEGQYPGNRVRKQDVFSLAPLIARSGTPAEWFTAPASPRCARPAVRARPTPGGSRGWRSHAYAPKHDCRCSKTGPQRSAATDPSGARSIRTDVAPRCRHLVRGPAFGVQTAQHRLRGRAYGSQLAQGPAHGGIVPGALSGFTSAAFGRVARRSISIHVCGTRNAAKPSAE